MKTETVEISALAYGGAGIGHLNDGRVVFIPGTLPQETVEIRITAEKKRFVQAQIEKIISPSDARCQAPCPLYGQCPGCVYMHCDYSLEVAWKNRQFHDFLTRNNLAGASVIAPPFASPESLYYRNKLILHRNRKGQYGYFGMDNRTILPVSKCFLADKKINALLPQAVGAKALFRSSSSGELRQIDPRRPGELSEELPGAGKFTVAGNGFFQTNPAVAAELVKEVVAAVGSSKHILELYCGVGVFSIAAARQYKDMHTTGIELNSDAIGHARKNAQLNQVANRCKFFTGDAGKMLDRLSVQPDSVIIDPPRSGSAPEVLEKIIALGTGQIVYISCAADTLTRDLKQLTAAGYQIKRARVLDMFPRTAHFESVTILEKSLPVHSQLMP